MLKFQLILSLILISSSYARAEEAPATTNPEDQTIEKQEDEVKIDRQDPALLSTLKEKYNLTDEQIKSLSDKGLTGAQMIIASSMAKESGKSIDDILKLRLEEKKGWGRIAKDLGVKPGSIGEAVSSLHRKDDREKHQEKLEKRIENKAARLEKKAERAEKRAERAEKRAERLEKREAKSENGHGKNH